MAEPSSHTNTNNNTSGGGGGGGTNTTTTTMPSLKRLSQMLPAPPKPPPGVAASSPLISSSSSTTTTTAGGASPTMPRVLRPRVMGAPGGAAAGGGAGTRRPPLQPKSPRAAVSLESLALTPPLAQVAANRPHKSASLAISPPPAPPPNESPNAVSEPINMAASSAASKSSSLSSKPASANAAIVGSSSSLLLVEGSPEEPGSPIQFRRVRKRTKGGGSSNASGTDSTSSPSLASSANSNDPSSSSSCSSSSSSGAASSLLTSDVAVLLRHRKKDSHHTTVAKKKYRMTLHTSVKRSSGKIDSSPLLADGPLKRSTTSSTSSPGFDAPSLRRSFSEPLLCSWDYMPSDNYNPTNAATNAAGTLVSSGSGTSGSPTNPSPPPTAAMASSAQSGSFPTFRSTTRKKTRSPTITRRGSQSASSSPSNSNQNSSKDVQQEEKKVIEWIKASKHIAMLPQVSSEQNKRASSDLGRSTPSNVAEFIRELTSTDVEQNSFASSFLMCYRFFMTNDQLLSCLLCKFIATPDVIGESVDVAGRMILRLRVCDVLKKWIFAQLRSLRSDIDFVANLKAALENAIAPLFEDVSGPLIDALESPDANYVAHMVAVTPSRVVPVHYIITKLFAMNKSTEAIVSKDLISIKTALVLLQQLFSLDNKAQAVIIMNSLADSGYCRPETLSINGQRNIYYRFLIKDYPKPLISPSQEQELSLELIQIHPLEFARQLTMIDQAFVHDIDPYLDLVSFALQRGSSALDRWEHFIHQTSSYILTEILTTSNLRKRTTLLERVIMVANECLLLHNYNSLVNIVQVLSHPAVFRLSETWRNVAAKSSKIFEKLRILATAESNYEQIRVLMLKPENRPCIPYLGMLKRDFSLACIETSTGPLSFNQAIPIVGMLESFTELMRYEHSFKFITSVYDNITSYAQLTPEAALKLSRFLEEPALPESKSSSSSSSPFSLSTKKGVALPPMGKRPQQQHLMPSSSAPDSELVSAMFALVSPRERPTGPTSSVISANPSPSSNASSPGSQSRSNSPPLAATPPTSMAAMLVSSAIAESRSSPASTAGSLVAMRRAAFDSLAAKPVSNPDISHHPKVATGATESPLTRKGLPALTPPAGSTSPNSMHKRRSSIDLGVASPREVVTRQPTAWESSVAEQELSASTGAVLPSLQVKPPSSGKTSRRKTRTTAGDKSKKSMSEWTDSQLDTWLTEHKLGHLTQKLQENFIGPKALPHIQLSDLVACGIAVGPARLLITHIRRHLAKEESSTLQTKVPTALAQAIQALSDLQGATGTATPNARISPEMLEAFRSTLDALKCVASASGL